MLARPCRADRLTRTRSLVPCGRACSTFAAPVQGADVRRLHRRRDHAVFQAGQAVLHRCLATFTSTLYPRPIASILPRSFPLPSPYCGSSRTSGASPSPPRAPPPHRHLPPFRAAHHAPRRPPMSWTPPAPPFTRPLAICTRGVVALLSLCTRARQCAVCVCAHSRCFASIVPLLRVPRSHVTT